MKKINLIWICIFLLSMFSPLPTYGNKRICTPQEIERLKSQDEEFNNKIEDLECEIAKLKEHQGSIDHRFNAIEDRYKTAISEISNYQRTADTKLKVANKAFTILSVIIGFVTLLAGTLGAWLYKHFRGSIAGITGEAFDIVSGAEREANLCIADLYNIMAYQLWSKYEETDPKKTAEREHYLANMVKYQSNAQELVEQVFGTEIEKMKDNEKFKVINIWQNRAYYLALKRDLTHSSWAIEKARIAFEWGSGIRPFVPPEGYPLPIMSWIDTYFFVLKSYDIPEFREEWMKNYQTWSEAIEEYDSEDTNKYE